MPQSSPADDTLIRAAVDQAAGPIVIADALGRITYANAAVAALVGVPAARIRGRHFSSLMVSDLPIGDLEQIAARVAVGQTWSRPVLGRRRDGSRFHLDLLVSPVRDEHGAVTHSIALLRDLTEERAIAHALAGELRQQAAVGAALASLDPNQPIAVLAGEVASAVLVLEGADFSRVIALGTREHGEVLADRSSGPALPRQLSVPAARTRHLQDRAAEGAWVEAWVARRAYGRYGEEVRSAGIRAVGFAPLRHAGRPIGVLAVGTRDARGAHVLERHLTALSHIGALASGLLGPGMAEHQRDAALRTQIETIIAERSFASVFQPIVRLADGDPIAYEALTRFSDGSPPERRFADAEAIGLGIELETATLASAAASAEALPPGAILSVNVSPAFIIGHGSLTELVARASRPVVLEITEREPIEDYGAFREAIAGLDVACDWAVDDAGAGYASLRHIIELRPRYVKLDRGLVIGVNADPIRQALVAGMLHFATSIGLEIIAEGIETEAERLTLQHLGVALGQGFLFGRPVATGG